MISPFKKRVIEIVRLVPHGKVVSYGQVALMVGMPRAARQVGWILRGSEGNIDLPWWRVVNNKGSITIKGTKYVDRELQRKLLRAEGVVVSEEFTLDIKIYRFLPDKKLLKQLELSEAYITKLLEKYVI